MLSSARSRCPAPVDDPARTDTCGSSRARRRTGGSITCTLAEPLEPVGSGLGSGRWTIQVEVTAAQTQDVDNEVRVLLARPGHPRRARPTRTRPTTSPATGSRSSTRRTSPGQDGRRPRPHPDELRDGDRPPDRVTAGDQVVYTLTVSNQGLGLGVPGGSIATNVVVADFLPAGLVGRLGHRHRSRRAAGCTPGIARRSRRSPARCNVGDPGRRAVGDDRSRCWSDRTSGSVGRRPDLERGVASLRRDRPEPGGQPRRPRDRGRRGRRRPADQGRHAGPGGGRANRLVTRSSSPTTDRRGTRGGVPRPVSGRRGVRRRADRGHRGRRDVHLRGAPRHGARGRRPAGDPATRAGGCSSPRSSTDSPIHARRTTRAPSAETPDCDVANNIASPRTAGRDPGGRARDQDERSRRRCSPASRRSTPSRWRTWDRPTRGG